MFVIDFDFGIDESGFVPIWNEEFTLALIEEEKRIFGPHSLNEDFPYLYFAGNEI